MLSILVERGRTDHPQLAAREHRLDHVASVDRALCAARTDDRVHLVQEGDHLALGVGDLLQDCLEAFLELAAVLRPCDHRPEVQCHEALVAQALRDVTFHYATRQALDDRRLADAGLAYEDRVVLRPPRQDLHDASNLVVAPDHRVDLPLTRRLGEVAPVLLQGLVLLLGVVTGDAMAAAHQPERLQNCVVRDARCAHHLTDAAGRTRRRQQQVLGR